MEWVSKDPVRFQHDFIKRRTARWHSLRNQLKERAKQNAKTLEELVAVAKEYGVGNPVGWAKSVMWHREQRKAGSPDELQELIEVGKRRGIKDPRAWAERRASTGKVNTQDEVLTQ